MKTMYAPVKCPKCGCKTLDEQGVCMNDKCEFTAPVCEHCQDTGWRCDSIGCTVDGQNATPRDPICFQCDRLSICDCKAGDNSRNK